MLGWPGALDWGLGETGVTRDGCMGGMEKVLSGEQWILGEM